MWPDTSHTACIWHLVTEAWILAFFCFILKRKVCSRSISVTKFIVSYLCYSWSIFWFDLGYLVCVLSQRLEVLSCNAITGATLHISRYVCSILTNRHVTACEFHEQIGISQWSVEAVIHKHLGFKKHLPDEWQGGLHGVEDKIILWSTSWRGQCIYWKYSYLWWKVVTPLHHRKEENIRTVEVHKFA
jgi:hypothetical protein